MIEKLNFSNQTTPTILDSEYRNCTFCFDAPIDDDGTKKGNRLFPGDDEFSIEDVIFRTFVECNLVNCEPPPGAILIGCNTTLTELVVVDQDVVTIDGEDLVTDIIEQHIYGRFNPKTETYEYKNPVVKVSK